ncbi:MAG TPA: hypothetical protein VKN99_00595 [Polyangia bacterium]|nr:hypothetical protein [Polyangia bacterium]
MQLAPVTQPLDATEPAGQYACVRLGFWLCVWALLLAGPACSRCPSGTTMVKGRCVGQAQPQARYMPRYPPPTPADMPKRAPLGAPELKPLGALAPIVLSGKSPRWYESVDEVRKQAGLPAEAKLVTSAAWQIGPVYSLASTPNLGPVPTQLDYFFLGDNLIGYAIRFLVEDAGSQKLWDDLAAQARKSYGPPAKQADGDTDWALPRLAVHASLSYSDALTHMRKHPVHMANIHWTIPPSLK